MRKAAAVLFVVIGVMAGSVLALSGAQETTEFTLAANAGKTDILADTARLAFDTDRLAAIDAINGKVISPPDLGRTARVREAASLIAADVADPVSRNDSARRVSLSFFMGRGHGDPFSTLHERYAWKTNFKTGNLGAGVYRDIPITKTIRIKPYVGVIRSSARLRPSSLYEDNVSYEYGLTAICIGLPLVCGF